MKGHICRECAKKYKKENGATRDGTKVPILTGMGAVGGAVAGILGGAGPLVTLVLVQAGGVAGLAGDVVRCRLCGKFDDEVYEIKEVESDQEGCDENELEYGTERLLSGKWVTSIKMILHFSLPFCPLGGVLQDDPFLLQVLSYLICQLEVLFLAGIESLLY